MSLIYYRGLNCHLASVINLAADAGIEYQNTFATLWSEKDYFYDRQYGIYKSDGVMNNLERAGLKFGKLNTDTPDHVKESLSRIGDSGEFVLGIDMFHTPWSPFHNHFHGSHFIYVKKEPSGRYWGFDPTYDMAYMPLEEEIIVNYAFEISGAVRTGENLFKPDLLQEAKTVLQTHPEASDKLMIRLHTCANERGKALISLIELITAIINNRYLFQKYLRFSPQAAAFSEDFFTDHFLQKWEAVKNGLYKIKILKQKEDVIDEVNCLFQDVIQDEITMAEKIVETLSRNR